MGLRGYDKPLAAAGALSAQCNAHGLRYAERADSDAKAAWADRFVELLMRAKALADEARGLTRGGRKSEEVGGVEHGVSLEDEPMGNMRPDPKSRSINRKTDFLYGSASAAKPGGPKISGRRSGRLKSKESAPFMAFSPGKAPARLWIRVRLRGCGAYIVVHAAPLGRSG